MNNVYLGLGSNVGDSLEVLNRAIKLIDDDKSCSVLKVSSFYETSPYGNVDQNNFFNCAIEIITGYGIESLFSFTKGVEKQLGRKKRERWGPREVDIDILLYDNLVIETDKLKVPHEDLINRDFVLVPLLELNQNLIHPESKKLLSDYLDTIEENHILNKLK